MVVFAHKDSTLRKGHSDSNDGGAGRLLLKTGGGIVRVIVGFVLPAVPNLTYAGLRLFIHQNANTWDGGRYVAAYRLHDTDWVEGNGAQDSFGDLLSTPGTGAGVTWACRSDENIANGRPDCAVKWNGGIFDPTPVSKVMHMNGLTGFVSWDVTTDVRSLLWSGATSVSYLLKKENEGLGGGKVYYLSREGAAYLNMPEAAPQLELLI